MIWLPGMHCRWRRWIILILKSFCLMILMEQHRIKSLDKDRLMTGNSECRNVV